jgi:peroxiredoxin
MPEGVGTNVGDIAPGFTLKSATGGEHSLESYRGDKNLVVIFYRAFW